MEERADGSETLKLAGITAAWLALGKGLVWVGDRVVPDAWKAKIALSSFLMACQITTTAIGLALSFGLLARPREELGLSRPRLGQLALTALLAPSFLVTTTVVALQVALPTLLEELRTRGAGASRQAAGEFGRMLEQGRLLPTLLWAAILAATTEELLFRGALFSLVERVARAARAALEQRSLAPAKEALEQPSSEAAPHRGLWGRALDALVGLAPVVIAAGVFGLMHGDLRGGVGIVRVVSSTLLGLGAGLLRRWTGTIFAPVLLHFLNNTLVIGQGRRWFSSSTPSMPLIDGVPNGLLAFAALGLAAAALLHTLRPARGAPRGGR